MITIEEAKRIGNAYCIDALGRGFVEAHRDNGCAGYGKCDGGIYCCVQVDDKPPMPPDESERIILDNTSKYPYIATCIVSLEDSAITPGECVAPILNSSGQASNAV